MLFRLSSPKHTSSVINTKTLWKCSSSFVPPLLYFGRSLIFHMLQSSTILTSYAGVGQLWLLRHLVLMKERDIFLCLICVCCRLAGEVSNICITLYDGRGCQKLELNWPHIYINFIFIAFKNKGFFNLFFSFGTHLFLQGNVNDI